MKNCRIKALIKFVFLFEKEISLSKKKKMLRSFPYQEDLSKIITYINTKSLRNLPIFGRKIGGFSKKYKGADLRFDLFLNFLSLFPLIKTITDREIEIYATLLRDTTRKEAYVLYQIFKGKIVGFTPKLIKTVFSDLVKKHLKFTTSIEYSPEQDLTFPLYAEPFSNRRVKLFVTKQKIVKLFESEVFEIPDTTIASIHRKLNRDIEIDMSYFDEVVASDIIVSGKLQTLYERRKQLKKCGLKLMPYKEINSYSDLYNLCKSKSHFSLLRDPLSFNNALCFSLENIDTEIINLEKVVGGKRNLKKTCGNLIAKSLEGEERIVYEIPLELRKTLWKEQKNLNRYYGKLILNRKNPQFNRLVSILKRR